MKTPTRIKMTLAQAKAINRAWDNRKIGIAMIAQPRTFYANHECKVNEWVIGFITQQQFDGIAAILKRESK